MSCKCGGNCACKREDKTIFQVKDNKTIGGRVDITCPYCHKAMVSPGLEHTGCQAQWKQEFLNEIGKIVDEFATANEDELPDRPLSDAEKVKFKAWIDQQVDFSELLQEPSDDPQEGQG